MSLYVCGDVHQDIDLGKLTSARFAAKGLSKNDYVLICGDCGAVWDGRGTDRYLQKWYDRKPWTTLFIDGNFFSRFFFLYSLASLCSSVSIFIDLV